MEQKKKSVWPLLIIIILLLIITALVFYILHNRTTNGVTTKTETSVKESTKNDTTVVDNTESSETMQIIYGSSYDNTKSGLQTLGTIKVNTTSYEIKVEKANDEVTSYLGDKKFELQMLDYVAIMDNNFIVIKLKSTQIDSSQIYFYDEKLNEVHDSTYNLVDTFSSLENDKIKATRKYTKDIIDSKHLTISECIPVYSGTTYSQKYVEKLLTFENNKITEDELTVVENIFCSSQK